MLDGLRVTIRDVVGLVDLEEIELLLLMRISEHLGATTSPYRLLHCTIVGGETRIVEEESM